MYPQEIVDLFTSSITRKTTSLDIRLACNRVVAEDIYSPIDRPWTDISHVDGYAIKSSDTEKASSSKPVVLKIVRDVDPRNADNYVLGSGEAVFVETGYPIPRGADAVIPIEAVREVDNQLYVYSPVKKYYNVFRKGSDVRRNSLILRKGSIITPAVQKLLIDLGISRVRVYQKPKISILLVGDEIVDAPIPPSTKAIPASTKYLLKNIIEYYGGEVTSIEYIRDEPSQIANIVENAVEENDIIVSVGGVSMGPKDFTWISLYKYFKPKIYFRGTKIHPGRSTSGFLIRNKIVINLPGLPQSTITGLLFILIPLINYFNGLENKTILPYITLKSKKTYDLSKYYGFYRIRYANIDLDNKVAEIQEDVESYFVSPIVYSDGIVIVEPNRKRITEGEPVKVYFIPPIHSYKPRSPIL